MASADFSQFVVTTHFFMRLRDLPGYSHVLSLFTRRIYRKRFRVAIGLCFVVQTCPRFRPYMRFLFVRPEFCPLGDLSTPNIRLSSDSTSRWTPLSLAKPSHYRATSGLSPYRTSAHRAHPIERRAVAQQPFFFIRLHFYYGISAFSIRYFWQITCNSGKDSKNSPCVSRYPGISYYRHASSLALKVPSYSVKKSSAVLVMRTTA